MRYADGTAFRRALADRLRRQYPDQDVGRLQKRVAMERFLARVVAALPEHARLKGGYALELRLERARATQDLDVALRGLPGDAVLEALRDASELDLGDHLRYRIEMTTRDAPQGAPDGGQRLTVVPELGGQRFMPFPLDVGVGDADPGAADVLRGGIDLSFADLAPLHVPAVSVVGERVSEACDGPRAPSGRRHRRSGGGAARPSGGTDLVASFGLTTATAPRCPQRARNRSAKRTAKQTARCRRPRTCGRTPQCPRTAIPRNPLSFWPRRSYEIRPTVGATPLHRTSTRTLAPLPSASTTDTVKNPGPISSSRASRS